jgi:hypothetical protein
MGTENLTLRSVSDLAWALGWKPVFELKKTESFGNYVCVLPTVTATTKGVTRPGVFSVTMTAGELKATPVVDFAESAA